MSLAENVAQVKKCSLATVLLQRNEHLTERLMQLNDHLTNIVASLDSRVLGDQPKANSVTRASDHIGVMADLERMSCEHQDLMDTVFDKISAIRSILE